MLQNIFSFIQKIHSFILDLLFPIRCASCGASDQWICESCISKITLLSEHCCPYCEKNPTPDGRVCFSCAKKSSLDGLISATHYSEIIKKTVHRYKYKFIRGLHEPLGNLITKAMRHTAIPLPDTIIPIPLHPRRLRWRGFNQSTLLAHVISKNLAPPLELETCETILKRIRYTQPQMKLVRHHDRQENIKEAFACTNPEEISGKTILLIDDIATTGSTLFECARILKSNGAKQIFAAVVARQSFKKH